MEKRLNERLLNAIVEEFADLMDFGHSKMEAYEIIANHWDVSKKTIQRAISGSLSKTLSNDTKTLSNDTKTLSNDTKTLSNDTKTLSKTLSSNDIVDNVCSMAKCNDYQKAFEKLRKQGKIPNTGAVLSNGTKLLF